MSKLPAMQLHPGRGLGFITLGGSLHDILSRLKSQPHLYRGIDVSYSPSEPLNAPVILNLPANGFRLRFDGPDQRLRLIEVLDFSKTQLTYNNKDVVKLPDLDESSVKSHASSGPAFRHVYDRIIGPTFPGEYVPSATGSDRGTYILSYPGIAFTFSLQDSAWTPNSDFVSVLSSSAATSAISMAIFDGQSWPEARQGLYNKPCPNPRSLALSSRGREFRPDEIDLVEVRKYGRLGLIRRSSPSFEIILGTTTPQDLVAELGPPDAIYRKSDQRLSIHKTQHRDLYDHTRYGASPPRYEDPSDTDQSSIHTTTDDSDVLDEGQTSNPSNSDAPPECFYNYFQHGFDIFVAYPKPTSTGESVPEQQAGNLATTSPHDCLVVTKVLLHGNIPGSYPFNRYRRSRWVLASESTGMKDVVLNSETPFSVLSECLQKAWRDDSSDLEESSDQEKTNWLGKGMVLARGWGNSPASSIDVIGEMEDSTITRYENPGGGDGPGLGNTKLFGCDGLVFEVLKNDTVSCLTIY